MNATDKMNHFESSCSEDFKNKKKQGQRSLEEIKKGCEENLKDVTNQMLADVLSKYADKLDDTRKKMIEEAMKENEELDEFGKIQQNTEDSYNMMNLQLRRLWKLREDEPFFFTRKMHDIMRSIGNRNANTLVLKTRQCGMTTLVCMYTLLYFKMHRNEGKTVYIVSQKKEQTTCIISRLSRYYGEKNMLKTSSNCGCIVDEICGNYVCYLSSYMDLKRLKINEPDIVFLDETAFWGANEKKKWEEYIHSFKEYPKVVETTTINPKNGTAFDELMVPKTGVYPYMPDMCLDIVDGTTSYDICAPVEVFFVNWYETQWGIKEGITFTRDINGTEIKIQMQADDVKKMLAEPSGVIKTLTHEGWKLTSPTLEKMMSLCACNNEDENIERSFKDLYKNTIMKNASRLTKKEALEITMEDIISIFTNPLFWESVFEKEK